ncbi:ATP-dependent DNA helicase RecQ, partial [hydrothermal vent metagenome]
SDAWMMYGLQDVIMLKQMMESSQADEAHKRVERHKLDSMLGFAELTTCRRQSLLKYFGDHMEQACGNCDTCLNPVETWDASVAAQKALSCVHRTGQLFGVTYLTDVLLGKKNERILNNGHDKLSVYGIGDELDSKQWRNLFRQLIARNLLNVDVQGHGSLLLTETCRAVLKGEQSLHLRKQRAQVKTRKASTVVDVSNRELWEALRATRKRLAEEMGVPPYVVFHDASLMDMVDRMPQNHIQFSQVSGVGESKLENYADDFLAVLAEYSDLSGSSSGSSPGSLSGASSAQADTLDETLQLFKCGMDAESIAAQRGLTQSTVVNHLARLIEQGQVLLGDVVNIPQQEIERIQNVIVDLGEEARKLKPIFEYMDGQYDYETIRCVKAAMGID